MILFIPAKKRIMESAPGKNSALVPVPTAGCLLRERLAEYHRVVRFD